MRQKAILCLIFCLSACQGDIPFLSQPASLRASSAGSACDSSSRTVSVGVYANPDYRDFMAQGSKPDRSQPLFLKTLKVGGESFMTNLFGHTDVPREMLTAGTTLSVEGYHPTRFTQARPCDKYYLALSPLSGEEQRGNELPLEKASFGGLAQGLHFNQATGFYYGVLRSEAELDNFTTAGLMATGQTPDAQTLIAKLRAGLRAGKQLVLFSHGREAALPDSETIARMTRLSNTAILASHQSEVLQEPLPTRSLTGISTKLTEAVLIPAKLDTVIFHVHTPGASSLKKRLEVKLAQAAIPAQPGAKSSLRP